MVIKWKRIENGEYKSSDNRFIISKSIDKMWGNHWLLRDLKETNYFKSMYAVDTLKAAKLKAESLLE